MNVELGRVGTAAGGTPSPHTCLGLEQQKCSEGPHKAARSPAEECLEGLGGSLELGSEMPPGHTEVH